MKKIFLLLFLGSLSILDLNAQGCNEDSVVITRYSFAESGNVEFNYIRIDSFDVINGTLNSCEQSGSFGPPGPFACQQHFFTRRYLELTTAGDTSIYSTHPGTGSGFVNERRIEKVYDSVSGKILERKEFTGNGQTWLPFMEEIWSYDSSYQLLNYERITEQGNVILENDSQAVFNYASGSLQSVLYQEGLGGNWLDLLLISYTYNSFGQKDSVRIQKIDSSGVNWVDSLHLNFDPANNYYATYISTVHDTTGNLVDSLRIVFDTLNNIRSYYFLYDFFWEQHDKYDFVGNSWYKKIFGRENVTCYGINKYYLYDQYGVFLGYDEDGNCGHSFHIDHDLVYDSLYRPLSFHSSRSSLYAYSGDSIYFYNSPTDISLYYIPVTEMGVTVCNGDTVQPFIIITGGCSPYRFSWQPSIGLSSDTVASPFIIVNDSVNYTITVTDSIGNTTTIIYTVRPTYMPEVSIHLTPYSCNMDSARFYPSYSNAGWSPTIQWYLNGVYDTTSHFRTFHGLQAGDSISCLLTTDNFQCPLQSTVVAHYIFNPAPIPLITYSAPALSSTPAFAYQWYFNEIYISGEINQTLVPQNTGNYTVRIWDSLGCSAISAPYYFQLTGVIENLSDPFLIYPNPANSYLTLKDFGENAEIEIFDLYGSLIRAIQPGTTSILEIELSKFPAAIYVISIRSDKDFVTKRITIVR